MKLSTMLLPTGEFVLIVAEATGDPETYKRGFAGFRDEIGSAGILVVDQPVEVEDALIDEAAHRADPRPKTTFRLPEAGPISFHKDESQILSIEDIVAARNLSSVEQISPAGLIRTGWTSPDGRCSAEPPREDGVAGADPEPEIVVGAAIESAPAFQSGDRVRVTGPSIYHADEDVVGMTGTIGNTFTPPPSDFPDAVFVRLDKRGPEGYYRRWYFQPASLELESELIAQAPAAEPAENCPCWPDAATTGNRPRCSTCPLDRPRKLGGGDRVKTIAHAAYHEGIPVGTLGRAFGDLDADGDLWVDFDAPVGRSAASLPFTGAYFKPEALELVSEAGLDDTGTVE